jgi:hypothetical protein
MTSSADECRIASQRGYAREVEGRTGERLLAPADLERCPGPQRGVQDDRRHIGTRLGGPERELTDAGIPRVVGQIVTFASQMKT